MLCRIHTALRLSCLSCTLGSRPSSVGTSLSTAGRWHPRPGPSFRQLPQRPSKNLQRDAGIRIRMQGLQTTRSCTRCRQCRHHSLIWIPKGPMMGCLLVIECTRSKKKMILWDTYYLLKACPSLPAMMKKKRLPMIIPHC